MLAFNTEWSPDAQDDLDLLWDWIFEESQDLDTADNFINKLIEITENACKYPKNGSSVLAISDDNFREIYFRGYTIVYEIIYRDLKVIVHEIYNQKRIFVRSYIRE